MLVPTMEVLTTGITSANSASYTLQSYAFHHKYVNTQIYKRGGFKLYLMKIMLHHLVFFNLKQILTNLH